MSILRSGLTLNCLRVMGAVRFEVFPVREGADFERDFLGTGLRGM
jgi:hypothetical protein